MSKKIGTDFHMVANDIYQAYDEGKKPQEKDLKELYELSKEFVKDYEEKGDKLHEYNKLTECLESLVMELYGFKVSTEDAVGSLKALVSYYSTEKVVFLNDEEQEFLVEELGENRNRSQELLDDESDVYEDSK